MYKYKISVIMPVYNSALYIKEAIESVIAQTVGIEHIQLIIVNDGSTDNSAEIAKAYAEKYPSIILVNKENGGVSSARNEALKHIEGKYTAFLDPDDKISPTTYAQAYEFFENNYDKTSVVSFPIYFFGSTQGEHPLNEKFKSGARVISLRETGDFQLHITSSLIKSEIAKDMHFKPLATSEDAEALLRVLIDFPYLGLVPGARYEYRKHTVSLITNAPDKKEWYTPHLDEYFYSVADYAVKKYGEIPSFVQNAIMYDLSWKMAHAKRPEGLSDEELCEFFERFYEIISRLDGSVIRNAPNLSESQKHHLLIAKNKNSEAIDPSEYVYKLEFIDTSSAETTISCRTLVPAGAGEIDRGVIFVNGEKIYSSPPKKERKSAFLGKEIVTSYILEFKIPHASLGEHATVYFGFEREEKLTLCNTLTFGKHFPLADYSSAFTGQGNYIITHEQNALIFEKSTKKKLKKCHHVFEKELWRSNAFAERKAVLARILARIYKKLHKKPLWIISDRLSSAGDNGEAFFEHLNKIKFKQSDYRFAIRRGSDYNRLKKQGKVVNRASLKYKILHLCADFIISSQGEDFVTDPFDYYGKPYKDILNQKKFIFLQHGVIKDDLSAWLNRYNKNIAGFVTSARAEAQSIINNEKYHYTKERVWQTGLPRFDKLENDSEKIITVCPTWRRYLTGRIDPSTGKWRNGEDIQGSEYVQFWTSLLKDERLLSALENHGYKILFVPHPNMPEICNFIDTSPLILIERNPNYTEIYKKSALMLTDYSSAVFDFAYLGKPIIYAQFDSDKFFSGAHTYSKGYFDYGKNGFGKVVLTLDGAVESVIQCIENGCKSEKAYLDRVNEFFTYRDRNNSARVLEKILELGAKNDNSK
ncbi:MAG: CDP-glycerol glycerophosphotransferase family protein [Clostridia bacterium]|nr:CDP-glycerol glycerophosphotransferase family protein [Clostridia bacterium]